MYINYSDSQMESKVSWYHNTQPTCFTITAASLVNRFGYLDIISIKFRSNTKSGAQMTAKI